MRTNWLVTTAAVAILASTGLAFGQTTHQPGAGGMEKTAPAPHAQGTQQKGQMQKSQMPNQAESGAAQQRRETTGQAPQQKGDAMQPHQSPAGAVHQQDKNAQQEHQQDKNAHPARNAEHDKNGQPGKNAQQDKNGQAGKRAQQDKGARGKSETTGRGDAAATNLTNEQRTKIKTIVVSKKIPQVSKVDFSVSVGAKVPRTVRFQPIPAEIIQIYPAWRGYSVILVGSELVVINPTSYEIVAVVVV
jgi:hypothetical protein